MENRYSRNRLYIDLHEQLKIKSARVLLAGAGIGSVIAECMLRLGFENLTIIDGDSVSLTNLNRQNYTENQISKSKVTSIRERLLSINPEAKIEAINIYLTRENVSEFISDYDVAINALDFDTDVPLMFDELCLKNAIPVLHPYNLGWGALVTVIFNQKKIIENTDQGVNEVRIVENFVKDMQKNGNPEVWLESIIEKYKEEEVKQSPPQLSVGAWLVASICTQITYDIVVKNPIKFFPDYYYLSCKMN